MTRYGMSIDTDRCIGCHTCAVACKMQNNVSEGMAWNRILTVGSGVVDGSAGIYPLVTKAFLPMQCQHCENAACVKVCPVGASYKAEDGRVLIDYDACIGCRFCLAACPYNARTFNWEEPNNGLDHAYGDKDVIARRVGVPEKCTLCRPRAERDEEPMCVKVCPARARVYGDLDDPESVVSVSIREKGGQQLLADKGTSPQLYYIAKGGIDSEHIEVS